MPAIDHFKPAIPSYMRRLTSRESISKSHDKGRSSPSPPTLSSSTNAPSRVLSPLSPTRMNSVRIVTDHDLPSHETLEQDLGDDGSKYQRQTISDVSIETLSDRSTEQPATSMSMVFAKNENGLRSSQSSAPEREDLPDMANITPQRVNGTPIRRSSTQSSLSPGPSDRLPLPKVGSGSSISAVRIISAEFETARKHSSLNTPVDGGPNNVEDSPAQPQWNAAVGKANLGKSGRVIDKLMTDNDMLKRDLKIEKLNSEETRNAMRMTEERMAALQQEYEGRLHDAAITKVLLKKRERQLADMKQQLDYERQRAEEALEREKTWREAKEKAEVEARIRVEETTNHALLMEGRYKALSSHWDEQKEELGRARTKLSKQVQSFRDDMIRDGDKIVSLQQICDEYRTALESERKQKEQISKNFEDYKEENENFLAPLKSKLRHQEEEYEGKIAQAQEALNKLQWALGVNENVKGI